MSVNQQESEQNPSFHSGFSAEDTHSVCITGTGHRDEICLLPEVCTWGMVATSRDVCLPHSPPRRVAQSRGTYWIFALAKQPGKMGDVSALVSRLPLELDYSPT